MTKKTISKCAAMLLCAVASFNVNAQVNADNIITDKQTSLKGTTALNVVVDNAIEVVMNSKVTSVGFRLATAKQFREDVEEVFPNVFDVTSNNTYNISVTTKEKELSNGDKKIPVSAISIKIAGEKSAELGGEVAAKQPLSNTTPAVLTKLAKETIKQPFSLAVSKTKADSPAFLVPGGLYTTDLYITATQD